MTEQVKIKKYKMQDQQPVSVSEIIVNSLTVHEKLCPLIFERKDGHYFMN